MTSRLILLSVSLVIALGAWGLWNRADSGLVTPSVVAAENAPRGGLEEPKGAVSLDLVGRAKPQERVVLQRAQGHLPLEPQPSTFFWGGKRDGVPVRVLDRTTGLPVKGIAISVVLSRRTWVGFSEDLGRNPVTTDEQGRADVDFPHPGPLSGHESAALLILQGEGYATAVKDFSRRMLHEGRRTFRIDRSAELRGRVTFATALSGRVQKVRLRRFLDRWRDGAFFGGDIFGDGRIGPDGEFSVKDVPPGMPFRVEILSVGEVVWTMPSFVSLRSGEVRTVDWEIAPVTVHVRGIEQNFRAPGRLEIWLAPAPSQGAEEGEVWPETIPQAGQYARTDSLGVATFHKVLPGQWRATVVDPEDVKGFPHPTPLLERPAPSSMDFTVEPASGAIHVELPVFRGAYIVGTVTGDGESDTGEVRIAAEGSGGLHEQSDEPGQRGGRFRIGPLVPGEYDMRAMPGRWSTYVVDPPVSATAGGEPVRLRLRPGAHDR